MLEAGFFSRQRRMSLEVCWVVTRLIQIHLHPVRPDRGYRQQTLLR
jgi:hypothetical protein